MKKNLLTTVAITVVFITLFSCTKDTAALRSPSSKNLMEAGGQGSACDPNGGSVSKIIVVGERGSSMDPNGNNLLNASGSGPTMDPLGGGTSNIVVSGQRGFSIDPNGNIIYNTTPGDQGWSIDPNGGGH